MLLKKKDLNKKAEWMKLISASVGTPGSSCTLVCAPLPLGDFLRCGAQGGPGEGAHYRSEGNALRWIQQCQRPFVQGWEAFGSV